MSNLNRTDLVQREAVLIATIEKMLPDLPKLAAPEPQVVIMHQDAFAADYQEEEYRLIGMAIKFRAGLCGKEISIHGNNRETVDQQTTVQ